jgi:hypothetical protein
MGVVAASGSCFCGVDSVATCLRCAERRCAPHYIVSVSWVDSGRFTAVHPDRTVVAAFAREWTEAQKAAYVSNGPACTRCREQAAAVAGKERVDKLGDAVGAYIKRPGKTNLMAVFSAWQAANTSNPFKPPTETDEDENLRRVFAAAFTVLKPAHELLELSLNYERRRRGTDVHVAVDSREPVLILPKTAVRASGQLVPVGSTGAPAEDWAVCVGPSGILPTAVYHAGYSNKAGTFGPSIQFTNGFNLAWQGIPMPPEHIFQALIGLH